MPLLAPTLHRLSFNFLKSVRSLDGISFCFAASFKRIRIASGGRSLVEVLKYGALTGAWTPFFFYFEINLLSVQVATESEIAAQASSFTSLDGVASPAFTDLQN